jgi:dual specificity tyrosine-phosphorylation-regulated kinase 1
MDQESFEPDKKRSARRPEEVTGSQRRLRYPPQQQQQPPPPQQQAAAYPGQAAYGLAQQQQQQPQRPGGYGADYSANLAMAAAASSAAYPGADPYAQERQQQLLYQQQQQQRLAAGSYAAAAGAPAYPAAAAAASSYSYYPGATTHAAAVAPGGAIPHMPVPGQSYIQPRAGRLPSDRPLMKLSVSLIDTYKHINTVYYEERDARRKTKEKNKGTGANNNGWDDENYDYIITPGELFYGRYRIKERIGKGSFGQVARAEDIESKREVAIKIIKSKKPFQMQAKTEIELLTHLWEKDPDDQHNVGKSSRVLVCMRVCLRKLYRVSNVLLSRPLSVRLLTHFMYRNHQCLVFEMLSLNLYELLKNTQFGGVSLQLIRKFAKQVLKALAFLARKEVDIIHCDLKPENILLRHPKKSGVKVIDFGSSCYSNKRMYSYIQSRFYRSPEVILGLPYTVSIDMWSLGCILVEMHTGEPLFSGSDQFDQMQKIVKVLGMIPDHILDKTAEQTRASFFEKPLGSSRWALRQTKIPSSFGVSKDKPDTPAGPPVVPSTNPVASLTEVVTAGLRQKKKYPHEAQNSARNYELFIDLVVKMLAYEPKDRIKPLEALEHPFVTAIETSSSGPPAATSAGDASAAPAW